MAPRSLMAPLMIESKEELKAESKHFAKTKKLTGGESCIRCCVNIPCSCGHDRALRSGISTKKFTIEHPLLAYRGDNRDWREIFEIGFSAYAPSRAARHLCCNGSSCLQACCLTTCVAGGGAGIGAAIVGSASCAFISALMAGSQAYGALAGAGCIYGIFGGATCIMEDACSPAVWGGQRLYKAPFVSNWSALGMSLSHKYAKPYVNTDDNYYSYIAYLEGCIRFDEFSYYAMSKGAEDTRSEEESPVYDAKEIFPRDPTNQTVAGDRIIAAIKNKSGEEKENIIIFNTKFGLFKQIQPALVALGLEEKSSSLSIDDVSKVETVLKHELGLSSDLESPSRYQMI